MREPRPDHESTYLAKLLAPAIAALKKDRELRGKLFIYAVQEAGADPCMFPGRMEHVLRGRTPPAYVFAVIQEWWKSLPPAATSTKKVG